MSAAALEDIRKEISVECQVEHAFETFTAGIAAWWPLRTHSVGEERAESVEVEPRQGGRVIERIEGGERCVWADVLVWDPPHRLVLSWYPGRGPEEATEVEVRFEPDGERTRVELVHRGWGRIPSRGAAARASYDGGWTPVLAAFEAEAGRR
jgi:uncharacterized protein YndB with AHSA1/START domain